MNGLDTKLLAAVELLVDERRCALAAGLADNARYMRDLDAELEAANAAYVGFAVTEIASLRARLSGPLHG